MMTTRLVSLLTVMAGLSACGGKDAVLNYSCDEPERYQAVTKGAPIRIPDGLDPLDEFQEMPIPKSEDAPVRPPGSRCIELPPAIRTKASE